MPCSFCWSYNQENIFKDMVKSKDSILKDYQNNVEIQESLLLKMKKMLNQIAYFRLGMFLIEVIFVAVIIKFGYYWPIGVLMCLPVLAFMALLKKQVNIQNNVSYAEKLLFIYQNEVDLITKGHQRYEDGSVFANEAHPYSSDLDIYGPSSLYALINRSNTTTGMKLIADRLSKPTPVAEIAERQQAVKELSNHIEDTFHFRAGLRGHEPGQFQIIADKLEHDLPGQLKFTEPKLLRLYTSVVPVLSILFLVLGSVYGGMVWSFMGLFLLFNSALIFFNQKHIIEIYYGFSGSSNLLNAISGTVKWTEDVKWESSYIRQFFLAGEGDTAVSSQIKDLSAIIRSFDVRLNPFLGVIFNLFLLWDLKCAIKLDQWYKRSSSQLITSMYTVCQFEELISFATLAHNEPEWNYPVVTDSFCLEVTGLGHPLIRQSKRVINDYKFDQTSTVDIVTGSNMAGKSTFLRTVGINMVLAFSGAPVCAYGMQTSVFELLTYMRIKDSLNDQTSTFKAELNRLKMILEGVKRLQHPLVLIDEMLRGTNSKDKYLGSKVFIQEMIKEHTPTLFATHDLQLSEMIAEYPNMLRNYHFDIQLAEGEMNFDYKLKHGACKTFNAALLLKEIGLSFNAEELN